MTDSNSTHFARSASAFRTTRWSMVLKARDKTAPGSADALESLCQTYWYPLYGFVRRRGYSPHDAQDLTQEFFARLLAKDCLQVVAKDKGRFRTFLIVAVKRFLANEWDRAKAQKRGGGQAAIPFDTRVAERRFLDEPSTELRADSIYERQWALTLLERAMSRLRGDYDRTGRTADFERLKKYLTAERGSIPYAEIAAELGGTEPAARVAVHRLRKHFRTFFREEIAHTLSDSADVDDEVRYVVSVLSVEQ